MYCSSTLCIVYEHMLYAQQHIYMRTHRHRLTDKHTLAQLVGTPVSLRVSIVVHLAVLCSTLCSQHACHLKPDTYGSASCWSDTPLLLWIHCRCLAHADVFFVKSLLCSIHLIARLWLCPFFFVAGHIFWTLWWTASNTQCLLLSRWNW